MRLGSLLKYPTIDIIWATPDDFLTSLRCCFTHIRFYTQQSIDLLKTYVMSFSPRIEMLLNELTIFSSIRWCVLLLWYTQKTVRQNWARWIHNVGFYFGRASHSMMKSIYFYPRIGIHSGNTIASRLVVAGGR